MKLSQYLQKPFALYSSSGFHITEPDVVGTVKLSDGQTYSGFLTTPSKASKGDLAIWLTQPRFREGDRILIRREGKPSTTAIIAEIQIEKHRHGGVRYVFSNGGWARDMVFLEGGPTLSLDGSVSPAQLMQHKKQLQLVRSKHAHKLRKLTDSGTLFVGMDVEFKMRRSPEVRMQHGRIKAFNLQSGRVQIEYQSSEGTKTTWVKRIWYPGGFYSVT